MGALRSHPGTGCPDSADCPLGVADRSVDRRSMLTRDPAERDPYLAETGTSGRYRSADPGYRYFSRAGHSGRPVSPVRRARRGTWPFHGWPAPGWGDSAVITGLTTAIVAAGPSRSHNQKHAALGPFNVNDGAYPVPPACQVSRRLVAAPAGRLRPLVADRPVLRFIKGGRR